MVFQNRARKSNRLTDSRRFSISEWDGAPTEELSGDHQNSTSASSTSGSVRCRASSGGSGSGDVIDASNRSSGGNVAALDNDGTSSASAGVTTSDDEPAAVPEMNLGSVYETIDRRKDAVRRQSYCSSDDDDVKAQVSGPAIRPTSSRTTGGMTQRSRPRSSTTKFSMSSIVPHSSSSPSTTLDASPCSLDEDVTVTPSSSASRTSYSSSTGTNIWTKLLGGNGSGMWDGLNKGGKDVFDSADEEDDEFDYLDEGSVPSCSKTWKLWGMAFWYETRHFIKTIIVHPHILAISLATFGVLCGVGLMAVSGQKGKYVKKNQMNADFIARETGEWFANEFRKAMLPLYSVQQGVIHSGYFNEAAEQIGKYPNLLIPETLDTPSIKRNVSGICDDPALQEKWSEIVTPVNEENDLNGVVFAYRLAPKNVFCLYERANMDSPDMSFGKDVGSSSLNEFWKTVTTEMFVHRKYSIFGPFTPSTMPEKEWVCGHIPVWTKPTDPPNPEDSLNVHGVDVPNAWGFVMNYLDWGLIKDRSNIYERFADCNLDFELTHSPDQISPKTLLSNVLAHSPKSDLLDDSNSVIISTNSLHGVWQNRVGRVDGWSPPWYPGAVTAVVISSLILGFLMASALVERQLHRNLVRKMLPRRAIAKLHRGQTVLEKFPLVSVFFSDIVGFTSMAGSMRPVMVMKMLNELYTELDMLVEKHQVYKVETIGDAYMVVGGAPNRVPAPLAAERVALFALDAIEFVKNFRTKDGDQIFIRAGIASGPTVAGVVGQAMPRYCFFGDTINFASRMESNSKKMKIQVAEVTYRLLQDSPTKDFGLTKRVEGNTVGIHVKGKGHQITYWLEKSRPRDASTKKMIDILPHELDDFFDSDDEEAAENHPFVPELPQVTESAEDDAQETTAMYTPHEIYDAMVAQDWDELGHGHSVLVAATDDRDEMILRASALLEYHLLRVLHERDAGAKISETVSTQITKFVTEVAETYNNDVKFHNLSHALHVTTGMNKLLSVMNNEDPLNSFSLVFAALVHDAGHTGMSNKILVETNHPLSEKYDEDVPIAERESIDIALEILFQEEYQEFRNAIIPTVLPKIQYAKTLFQSILVTDIATPGRVKLGIKRYDVAQKEQSEYDVQLCPLASHIQGVFEGVGLEESVKEEFPNEFVITHSGLQKCVRNEHMMLLSDVSHLMQGWENFAKWNFRLYKELNECFKKGFCGDPRDGWFEGQVGFLEHYILPLARRSEVYFDKPFADAPANNTLGNLQAWKQVGVRATAIMVNGGDDEEEAEEETLRKLYELPSLQEYTVREV